MTAEVAIMNKEAIALAADSAVTFKDETGQKIFTSASKIFTLSKHQPVGAMVYGNASLMGVPWETVIKVYRNHLGQKTYATLSEYSQDLISFVSNNKQIFSEEEQRQYVENSIKGYYQLIEEDINKYINETINKKGEISDKSIIEISSQVIKRYFDKWENTEMLPSVPMEFKDTLKKKYEKTIELATKEIFGKVPLTYDSLNQLAEIVVNLLVKHPIGLTGSNTSGLVITGFGSEDIWPSLESFSIEGKIGNYLKYTKIEADCIKMNLQTAATIKSFAQNDMVSTFMTGTDPNYQKLIDRVMKEIYSYYPQILLDHIHFQDKEEKEALKKLLDKIGQERYNENRTKLEVYRHNQYINPVMKVVEGLPKDELAAMAETLVSLTSFKKKVSMVQETVADPIDVAVISKGDGFIWIKRKHYFDPELNQHFFANYYQEVDTNGTKPSEKTN
ncbi:hypothetical protein JT359_06840 [Candidatus Poribacteria bacterium]|nr:hypothetical protein [Candidatus Poribacteria bacterium]